MFFLSGVSIFMLCGVYPVMAPSCIMIHCGASVWRGSFVFLARDFRATFLLVFMNFVVLSPIVKCISDGYILRRESLLLGVSAKGTFSESSLFMNSGLSWFLVGSWMLCGLYCGSSSSLLWRFAWAVFC